MTRIQPRNFSTLRALPHARAWTLAWPMIVSNMSVPLMGLADTAMLGHLDSPVFLGAVAIGSNIIALFYWMFAFLRMSTTSVAAQAMGAGTPHVAVLHMGQNTLLALGLGLALIALQSLTVPFVLWIIAPEKALWDVAQQYCRIRIFSAPAVLCTYVAMGWLIGLSKPKIALVITVATNLLNIGLDYLFIVHWHLEARGAAMATLIAEYAACACALGYIWCLLRQRDWRPTRWFDFSYLRQNLKLSVDLFIRTAALLFVINFFNAQSAYLGNEVLAANAILFQCTLFVAFFLDGYALAAEAMTAQAIGARKVKDFHAASAAASITALVIALLLSGFFAVFGSFIITLLTDLTEVAAVANQHLGWLVAMPLVSVWCYLLDGIFIGAGQARAMRNSMLLSVCFGFLLSWWIFRFLGNHGLWLAFVVFNALRGVSLAIAYYRFTVRDSWLDRPS